MGKITKPLFMITKNKVWKEKKKKDKVNEELKFSAVYKI